MAKPALPVYILCLPERNGCCWIKKAVRMKKQMEGTIVGLSLEMPYCRVMQAQ